MADTTWPNLAPELTEEHLRAMLRQIMQDGRAVIRDLANGIDESKRELGLFSFYVQSRLRWIAKQRAFTPEEEALLYHRGNELRQMAGSLGLEIHGVPTEDEERVRLHQDIQKKDS